MLTRKLFRIVVKNLEGTCDFAKMIGSKCIEKACAIQIIIRHKISFWYGMYTAL